MAFAPFYKKMLRQVHDFRHSSLGRKLSDAGAWLYTMPYSGIIFALSGSICVTACILLIDYLLIPLPNPGMLYLPLVAMLAYHWKTRYALLAVGVQLFCVYFIFLTPAFTIKIPSPSGVEELVVLAGVTWFVLMIVQLAYRRRTSAERSARQLRSLNRVGTALAGELDEDRLLHLIAETACNLTNAGFAAFTLRPLNDLGQPAVPSEGNLFHLAAVVGVSEEQERLFHRMPLGGEGLLAPIFRQGVSVLVDDALELEKTGQMTSREQVRQVASEYAHGYRSKDDLRSRGVPRGHPIVRSFLGVPLLDRSKQVRGGLLLGHIEPGRFTPAHERLLVGLAAQASVALENARLYRLAQRRAQELNAIFESIVDGVTLVDANGVIVRENGAARHLRATQQMVQGNEHVLEKLLQEPARQVLKGEVVQDTTVSLVDEHNEAREYLVNAAPLITEGNSPDTAQNISGAVVVWHDVTESRRLLTQRRAFAESEARRELLQLVLDELPSSIYLVRGSDARLVLANRATATVWGAVWQHDEPMKEFLEKNNIRVFGNDGLTLPFELLATMRAVQRGETIRQHQEVIRHADGTSLPVLVNAVALDARILHLPADMLHSTSERSEEPAAIVLHQDVTALKEAERLKDEFIGIAAHELRTPLAVLKGYAQMLLLQSKKGKGQKLDEWQSEALQNIDQATMRLTELTEDLLDVTRLQAGRLALHIAPTDLVALTSRVIKRLRLISEKHMLNFHAGVEHLVVDIDPQRMEQVLGNLLSNAIKYSPEGGEIDVLVQAQHEGNMALLSVQDHGIGIPQSQQTQIFGRFVRADNARDQGIGGTGLGLYLCRELIERQCGRIWFDSVEGRGSTFYVLLPLYQNMYSEEDVILPA